MFVSDPLSGVRDGWALVAAEDRSGWSSRARSDRLLELLAHQERVAAEVVRCAGGWDAVSAWADDGATSAAAWLAERAPLTRPAAARLLRSARLVRDHDDTAAALAEGVVSVAHVDVLASAAHGRSVAYGEHEDSLLTAAEALTADDLVTVVRRWRELADHELARRDAAANFDRRHFHISATTGGGMLGGFLDPTATATVIRALDAQEPPDPTGGVLPPRSLSQRRADALVALCEAATRGGVTGDPDRRAPAVAVDVVVDYETLLADGPLDLQSARCDILGVGPVPRSAMERILCDTTLGRVLLRGRSEVLDLGRRSRTVSRALRRAVILRDEHCQFPGCRIDAAWCDVHHVVH